MSNDAVELFWALLESSKYDQARSNVPKDFNWNVLHPTKKITLLVAACRFPDDNKEETAIPNLIEWLVRSGASLSQKCGNTTYCWTMWTEDGEEISVDYKGHSLLSYIEAWKLLFFDHKEKIQTWTAELEFLDRVMDRVARASSERQVRPRASVDEGILEIWEKFLHATASHDLDIEAADGRVTAHAQMLMEASPVVQAMLVSPMKERQTKQIKLKDTSSSAVTLFLEVLYTCSSQGDPDYKTALSALDLAHRWQVEVVVEILADFIEGLITEETFAAIAEHASLKGLDRLQKACQSFGLGNAAIQEQLGKGDFPKIVRALFQEKGAAYRAVKKRKRL